MSLYSPLPLTIPVLLVTKRIGVGGIGGRRRLKGVCGVTVVWSGSDSDRSGLIRRVVISGCLIAGPDKAGRG